MINKIRLLAGVLVLSIQVGCVSPTQLLDKEAVTDSLHDGQSPAEVRRLLGTPKKTETGSNGKSLDIFVMTQRDRGSAIPKFDVRSVYVLYDTTGHLEKFTWYEGRTTAHDARFDQQWTAGRSFTSEEVNRIQKNVSSQDDLIKMFGRPTHEGLDVYGNKIMYWVFYAGRETSVLDSQELYVRLDDHNIVINYVLGNYQP